MCTAISFGGFFGRNLDFSTAFGECVAFTPRKYRINFSNGEVSFYHNAVLGMARVEEGVPLYFDAMNEHGLACAGLRFLSERAEAYGPIMCEKVRDDSTRERQEVAGYELILRLLVSCKTVREAVEWLSHITVADKAFSDDLPPAELHWMVSDEQDSIVLEKTSRGLEIYDDRAGVLTNSPSFEHHMLALTKYKNLTTEPPKNSFAPRMELVSQSSGAGAFGLPGDMTSVSRFVRAVFFVANAKRKGGDDDYDLCQALHILENVAQIEYGDSKNERTQYTSVMDLGKRVYYYRTSQNPDISAVRMDRLELDADSIRTFSLRRGINVNYHI